MAGDNFDKNMYDDLQARFERLQAQKKGGAPANHTRPAKHTAPHHAQTADVG